MNMTNIDKLIEIVPQTFGEAILLYPWIAELPSHEWDNRTTIENAVYVIRHLTSAMHSDGCDAFDECNLKKQVCIRQNNALGLLLSQPLSSDIRRVNYGNAFTKIMGSILFYD